MQFMDVEESYNNWADQYDTNLNKTRDLEAFALKECLANISFESCLEVGCGTGKNTAWLLTKAQHITAIDLSVEMLSKAKEKIVSEKVNFIQTDINQPWTFTNKQFDVITFSLVLEHIEDIESVFRKASQKIKKGGYLYLGELHPFKQYAGSKARFETEAPNRSCRASRIIYQTLHKQPRRMDSRSVISTNILTTITRR